MALSQESASAISEDEALPALLNGIARRDEESLARF
jgi:hypothetical protein